MDDKKRTFKLSFSKIILVLFLGFMAFCAYGGFAYWQTQTIEDPKKCFTTAMFKINLCSTNINYVHYNQVPQVFYQALILSEDSSFWSHDGFDWAEIKESFRQNMEELKFVRGGSTITQQLAKNLYLSKDKTLSRKFKEFFLAKQVEKYLSKKEILEKYINVVEFGDKIYGLKAAANHYFSKTPGNLNVLESAYLVSLLPNPPKYGKGFYNKKLTKVNLKRMHIILDRLYRTQKIEDDLYVYCQTLLDNEEWPFPSFNLDDMNEDEVDDTLQLTNEDEMMNELKTATDQTEGQAPTEAPPQEGSEEGEQPVDTSIEEASVEEELNRSNASDED